MATFWFQNLAAHWLQACLLAAAAAALAAVLRLKHPGIRLVLWQTVFALALALPLLQRWEPLPLPSAPVEATGRVTAVLTQGAAETIAGSPWPQWILLLLAAGVLLRIGWIGLGLIRLRQMRRLPPMEGDCSDEFEAAMRELGVRACLRRSDSDGPLNFGARRPIVVVPLSFQSLDREARRAVALHELLHVRRRDWVAAFVEEILLALVWFHPWSWWMRAQIRLAREETVDREVVSRLGSREAYATCLLSLAGYDLGGIQPGVALLRRRELRHRLDTLFQEVAMSPVRLAATVALLGCALTGVAVGAASAFPFTAIVGATTAVEQESSRRILQLVPPEYPRQAQDQRITGTVSVEVTANAAGDVSSFNVTGGPAALHDATVTAVRQWKFDRARNADVVVVEVGYQLTVRDGHQIPGWSFTLRNRNVTSADPASATKALRVGGDVKAPRMIKEVKPVYTPDAIRARVQGVVHLEATIGVDGTASDVKVLRSIPLLDAAAVEAIRQSTFEPGTRNGVAVPVVIEYTCQFMLREPAQR
jgi:TonB family protein